MTAEKTTLAIPDRLGHGDAFINPTSDPKLNLPKLLREIVLRGGGTVAGLRALTAQERDDGVQAETTGGGLWRFKAASTATDDGHFVLTPNDAPAAGRWVRMGATATYFLMAITQATADAAVLLTIPTGVTLIPDDFFWVVTTPFTGGTSSAIGVSSSNISGKTTKGDLLGGAAGDLTATLGTAGTVAGTIGAQWTTVAGRRYVMKAGDTIRFDRIASQYTAGVGSVGMRGLILTEAT